jgi:hypothetical protein
MISDSDWIKANHGRRFRLRSTFDNEKHPWGGATYGDPNLRPVVLIDVSSNRRTWGISYILAFGYTADTDEAIAAAEKEWDQVLYPRLLQAARRRAER